MSEHAEMDWLTAHRVRVTYVTGQQVAGTVIGSGEVGFSLSTSTDTWRVCWHDSVAEVEDLGVGGDG